MSNMNAKHNPRVSKNSAGGVSKLLWYTETKATVKLLLNHSVDEGYCNVGKSLQSEVRGQTEKRV